MAWLGTWLLMPTGNNSPLPTLGHRPSSLGKKGWVIEAGVILIFSEVFCYPGVFHLSFPDFLCRQGELSREGSLEFIMPPTTANDCVYLIGTPQLASQCGSCLVGWVAGWLIAWVLRPRCCLRAFVFCFLFFNTSDILRKNVDNKQRRFQKLSVNKAQRGLPLSVNSRSLAHSSIVRPVFTLFRTPTFPFICFVNSIDVHCEILQQYKTYIQNKFQA